MGHHIVNDEEGNPAFQSDKHPELPLNKVLVNLANPLSERGMRQLAEDYREKDAEFADDIIAVLNHLHPKKKIHFEVDDQGADQEEWQVRKDPPKDGVEEDASAR